MRPSNELPAVYVCREAVDFRKGVNGLAALVEEVLGQNPFSEQLFVFCNRRRDRVGILYWERNGFCLWQKRLEQDRLKIGETLKLSILPLKSSFLTEDL